MGLPPPGRTAPGRWRSGAHLGSWRGLPPARPYPDATPLLGHGLAHSAAGRRDGITGRGLPPAGRFVAAARPKLVGHLVSAVGAEPDWPGSAHLGRLYRAAGRHPARLLSRDVVGDRRVYAPGRPPCASPSPERRGRRAPPRPAAARRIAPR